VYHTYVQQFTQNKYLNVKTISPMKIESDAKIEDMRSPGIEPGSDAWKASILTIGLQTQSTLVTQGAHFLSVTHSSRLLKAGGPRFLENVPHIALRTVCREESKTGLKIVCKLVNWMQIGCKLSSQCVQYYPLTVLSNLPPAISETSPESQP
jgi:hypothetical protein